ncbi:hypothetical protein AFFFEF_00981 [Methylorubrum extorquens]|jgi:hypothetical protein
MQIAVKHNLQLYEPGNIEKPWGSGPHLADR